MRTVVNTLWSSDLLTAQRIGAVYDPDPYTTVNEALNVAENQKLRPGDYPKLGLMIAGIGGHSAAVGVDNIPITAPLDHKVKDAITFKPLPFVIRPRAEDITRDQRVRYALRKEITINGSVYYAYYGRRLDLTDVVPRRKRTWIDEEGKRQVEDYQPDQSSINPQPDTMSSTGTNITSGEAYYSSAIIKVSFTEADVRELLNVAKILYGDERYAIISEIGFCTNGNQTISISTPAGNENFNEAIACQVASFVTAKYEMLYSKQGFDFDAELGAIEPVVGAITVNDDPNNP